MGAQRRVKAARKAYPPPIAMQSLLAQYVALDIQSLRRDREPTNRPLTTGHKMIAIAAIATWEVFMWLLVEQVHLLFTE